MYLQYAYWYVIHSILFTSDTIAVREDNMDWSVSNSYLLVNMSFSKTIKRRALLTQSKQRSTTRYWRWLKYTYVSLCTPSLTWCTEIWGRKVLKHSSISIIGFGTISILYINYITLRKFSLWHFHRKCLLMLTFP